MMDLEPFKLDIDELINEFAQGGLTKLAEMKEVWRSRKFSFIFEASPSKNQAGFMQSLYAHSIGYMASKNSLSHRLGGLYCLYCLFETQPFNPPFKIHLSLGELKMLKNLVICAKQKDVKVVSALVKSMLDKNMFLFGFVDITEGSATERVNELTDIQDARVQVAYKKLFANTRIEHFIHMDLGMELDVDFLKRKSSEYAAAKELTIKEAGEMIDVQNIKHNTVNKQLIGDVVEKTAEEWNIEKGYFYQQTGTGHLPSEEQEANGHNKRQKCNDNSVRDEQENYMLEEAYGNLKEQEDNDEDFGNELEEALLCLPYEYENEETKDVKQ